MDWHIQRFQVSHFREDARGCQHNNYRADTTQHYRSDRSKQCGDRT